MFHSLRAFYNTDFADTGKSRKEERKNYLKSYNQRLGLNSDGSKKDSGSTAASSAEPAATQDETGDNGKSTAADGTTVTDGPEEDNTK